MLHPNKQECAELQFHFLTDAIMLCPVWMQWIGHLYFCAQSTKYTLHCAQYALKLHWTEPPMRMCGKTITSPFVKQVYQGSKISPQILMQCQCISNIVNYNTVFNATPFALSIQKEWPTSMYSSLEGEIKHRANWTAISPKVNFKWKKWKQHVNLQHFSG